MRTTIYCSFCGLSNQEVGPMLEKSDCNVRNRHVRICRECAAEAVKSIDAEIERQGLTDKTG